MARDAQAIAFGAFAQAHETLPELLALAPAAVPLALPSMVGLLLPIAPALGLELVNDTMTTALALCSASVPMSLRSSINPDNSVRRWLAAELPLVLPSIVEAATVSDIGSVVPVVASAKSWKATATKTLRKRSYKNKATATAQ
jgi:hypothetical protein